MRGKKLLAAGILAAMSASGVHAENDFVIDIGGISFDELVNTTITSVSKQEEKLQDAAAAVYVLSSDDIRRARVANIPDALRLVPGVHVVQSDASSWGVSIRGFNTSVFNNKLLILIDGRSVYDPLYAGTFWEVQDTLLQDVERIEVIRGPGGSLWGSNAVNGVINIITKSAAETQGGIVEIGTGTEERAIFGVRRGWKTAGGADARIFAKFNERDETWNEPEAKDDWRVARGGFRVDQSWENGQHQTLQGDLYRGRTGPISGTDPDGEYEGANLLYRWSKNGEDGSGSQVQAYWDYTDLDVPTLGVQRNTLDLEFQQNLAKRGAHSLIAGAGVRYNGDRVSADGLGGVSPEEANDMIYNLFLQDTISLPERSLKFTVGGKLSKNDFTGYEFQPSARFAWSGIENQTLWGAISRAVRTPSRLETDFTAFSADSRDDLNSEEMVAYEFGHRLVTSKGVSLESSLFVNQYDELVVYGLDFTRPPFFVVANNALEGTTHGLELSSVWKVSDRWRIDATATYLEMDLSVKSDGNAASASVPSVDQSSSIEDSDPHMRATLRSAFDLSQSMEIDAIIRYTDNIEGPGGTARVPSYVALDLGTTWRPRKDFEISLAGRNLLDRRHPETVGTAPAGAPDRNEIQRSVFGTATWRF